VQQGISVTRSVEGNTALMGGIGDNSNTGGGFIDPSLQVHRRRRRNQARSVAISHADKVIEQRRQQPGRTGHAPA